MNGMFMRVVQQGEAFVQDDTRGWFEDRERKVVICRDYPDQIGRAHV